MEPDLKNEIAFRKIFVFFSIVFVIFLFFIGILTLSSCNSIPELFKTADDVFDDAIKITVDKTALQQNTDMNINIQVKNKEEK